MSKRPWSAALLLVCLSGCTLFSKGHTHITYTEASGKLTMAPAKEAGQYALYVDNDPVAAVVELLKKGQMFGFEKNDEGRLRAVAGNYSTILARDTKTAKWIPLPYGKR